MCDCGLIIQFHLICLLSLPAWQITCYSFLVFFIEKSKQVVKICVGCLFLSFPLLLILNLDKHDHLIVYFPADVNHNVSQGMGEVCPHCCEY